MSVQPLPLDSLEISPHNVRTNEEDRNAVDALAASIAAKGLLLPLVVHPLESGEDREARFGVLAGGRRLRAFRLLAARGDVAGDVDIDCVIRDILPAEIVELSLTENILRRELRGTEIHAAVANMAFHGMSAEQIALECGQTLRWARQQLRLGSLHTTVFDAYEAGNLSLEQASAYAATEDTALQAETYDRLSRRASYEHRPVDIRSALKVGDRELARLLAFVGPAQYEGAGGRFEPDLFADGAEDRGRVVDEGLLRHLADTKREVIRAENRLALSSRDLRFAAEPPTFAGHTDVALELSHEEVELLTDHSDICATIDIDDEGRAEVRFWWNSRKAKGDNGKPVPKKHEGTLKPTAAEAIEQADGTYGQQARARAKDEHGVTADGLNAIRSLRRELLRGALVKDALTDGDIGRDYIIWSQLRQALANDRPADTGGRGLAGESWLQADTPPRDLVDALFADTLAHDLWRETLDDLLRQPFMAEDDLPRAFTAYVEATEGMKRLAAAVLAGLSLMRSADAPGWRIPMHDALANHLSADDAFLRRYWTPGTAFLGLFPKMKRLELAEPAVGLDQTRSWSKLPDKPLTAATAEALAAERHWVHPLLSFNVPMRLSITYVDRHMATPVEAETAA